MKPALGPWEPEVEIALGAMTRLTGRSDDRAFFLQKRVTGAAPDDFLGRARWPGLPVIDKR